MSMNLAFPANLKKENNLLSLLVQEGHLTRVVTYRILKYSILIPDTFLDICIYSRYFEIFGWYRKYRIVSNTRIPFFNFKGYFCCNYQRWPVGRTFGAEKRYRANLKYYMLLCEKKIFAFCIPLSLSTPPPLPRLFLLYLSIVLYLSKLLASLSMEFSYWEANSLLALKLSRNQNPNILCHMSLHTEKSLLL